MPWLAAVRTTRLDPCPVSVGAACERGRGPTGLFRRGSQSGCCGLALLPAMSPHQWSIVPLVGAGCGARRAMGVLTLRARYRDIVRWRNTGNTFLPTLSQVRVIPSSKFLLKLSTSSSLISKRVRAIEMSMCAVIVGIDSDVRAELIVIAMTSPKIRLQNHDKIEDSRPGADEVVHPRRGLPYS